jgi:peptide chain release factor subunit 1
MFTENDLEELLSYRPELPMVSLYINIYPHGPHSDNTRLQLNHLLKGVDLTKDSEIIQEYVSMEYDGKSRSLALFSCAEKDYFKTYSLGIPVLDQAKIMDRPFLSPLVGLLEMYARWGIILVDRQGARLFSFHMGELEEIEGFYGEAVKQVKRGGGASFHGRMGGSSASANIENIIDRNLIDISDHISNFILTKHIRRILIGGSDENIALIKSNLQKSWQSLVAATFPMSIAADHGEISAQAQNLIKKTTAEIHSSLVDQAITLAAKGERGVIGVNDTLNAIHSGQVQTLLVHQGYSETGFQCQGCGFMTTQDLEVCPFCGGQFQKIIDAVEYSIHEAKQKGAAVHLVSDNDALLEAGGIAAIMRY